MEWNTTVGGAVIAAGASVLTLIVSKEAKISEFRQEWINALREDLTTVVTYAFELQSASADKVDEPILKINEASTRIRLRLNPEEKPSKDLAQKLADLRQSFHDPKVVFSQEFFNEILNKVEDLLDVGQGILRAEWKRVKRGETVFRLALMGMAAGFALFAAELLRPGFIHQLIQLIRSHKL